MVRWQLQEAKAKLSELIRRCADEPQIVSKSGKDQAVVISYEEYQKLVGIKAHMVDFMSSSPLKGLKIDLERERTPARDVEL